MTESAGMTLSGEFTAETLLKLFSCEPPKYKIPTKYTGCRKAHRKLKKSQR